MILFCPQAWNLSLGTTSRTSNSTEEYGKSLRRIAPSQGRNVMRPSTVALGQIGAEILKPTPVPIRMKHFHIPIRGAPSAAGGSKGNSSSSAWNQPPPRPRTARTSVVAAILPSSSGSPATKTKNKKSRRPRTARLSRGSDRSLAE